MTLEMLANGRAERLIPPRDLRRRIFHRSFGRLQPSHAVPVTVAQARLRTVLVVISPDRVAGLALQRFLHDQPGRQLNQFILCGCCARSGQTTLPACAAKQVISSPRGAPLLGLPKPFDDSHAKDAPRQIASNFRTSPPPRSPKCIDYLVSARFSSFVT